MSEPVRHHYIPVFYLKRWTGSDRLLCEYSRPHNQTRAFRKSPKATGYVRDLYKIPGVSPEAAQFVEKKFMKLTDDWAARAVTILLAPHTSQFVPMNIRERAGWARFLYSLMVRNPEYLRVIEQKAAESIPQSIEESREQYDSVRGEHDPPTFDEFKDRYLSNPANMAPQSLLPALINSTTVIQAICDMRWSTCQVADTRHSFLTSDRPIIMTNGIKVPGAHIAIPLTPTRLFFAVGHTDEATYKGIRTMPPDEMVAKVNEKMASQARKYVYGKDDSQLRFVAKRLGKMLPSTPL